MASNTSTTAPASSVSTPAPSATTNTTEATQSTSPLTSTTLNTGSTVPPAEPGNQNGPSVGIIIGGVVGGVVVLVIIVTIIVIVLKRKQRKKKPPPILPKLNTSGLTRQDSEPDPQLAIHRPSAISDDDPSNYEDPNAKPATKLVIHDHHQQPDGSQNHYANLPSNDTSTGTYVEPLGYRPKTEELPAAAPSSSAPGSGAEVEVEQPLYIPMDVCSPTQSRTQTQTWSQSQAPTRAGELSQSFPGVVGEMEEVYTTPDQPPPQCTPKGHRGYVNLPGHQPVSPEGHAAPALLQTQTSGEHYQNFFADDQYYGNVGPDLTSLNGSNKNSNSNTTTSTTSIGSNKVKDPLFSSPTSSVSMMVSPETVAETLQGRAAPAKAAPVPSPKPDKAVISKVGELGANSPRNPHASPPGLAQAGARQAPASRNPPKPSPKPSSKPGPEPPSKSPQPSPHVPAPLRAPAAPPVFNGSSDESDEGEDYENLNGGEGGGGGDRDYVNAPERKAKPNTLAQQVGSGSPIKGIAAQSPVLATSPTLATSPVLATSPKKHFQCLHPPGADQSELLKRLDQRKKKSES